MPRLTEEQIAYCNRVSLLKLVQDKGLTPKQVGHSSFKLEGFGGLYINPQTNQWNCFAENKGGGPIQLLMFLEKIPWRQAADMLLESGFTPAPSEILTRPEQENEKDDFILPKRNHTFKHMIAYLLGVRKLDKEVVYHFIQNKQLYENTQRSCVFVGYDAEKEPRFASYRSTSTEVKIRGCVAGSDKRFVFAKEGVSDKVFVFESPIDLMSYLTLLYQQDKRNRLGNLPHHFISLDGLSPKGLENYLARFEQIKQIVFCLDNDQWANDAYRRFKLRFGRDYQVARHIAEPPAKDFNEMLVSRTLAREMAQDLAETAAVGI